LSARETIHRSEGRMLFGADPETYDRARPGHAERVYEILVERCGLGPGTAVLEVGPGTGQATRRLLELGASPLVALEPDPRLATHVRAWAGDRVDVRVVAVEDASLEREAFDLAAAASSFHWIEEAVGLGQLLAALRPGGWVATWWTLFGEGDRPDAFIRATTPLLEGLSTSPTRGAAGRKAHALDAELRLSALAGAGFVQAEHEVFPWCASWDTAGVRALYSTFSPIARLERERREWILDEIARIADEDFGGRIERKIRTSLYTARKPS
jgi:SAM-dependent methyltransferase